MSIMEQSQSPLTVAAHLLWIRRNTQSTPMHLLKLTYISHGWMLGISGEALINEPVEAWTYGPVVPSIYHSYKSFGGNSITAVPVDHSDKFTDHQRELIQGVADAYSAYTALELSNITHQPGTPWDIVQREYGTGAIIPNELIQDWYRKRASDTA